MPRTTSTQAAASLRPVVVYGATGYTGTLACEFLAKLGIPFVAAGRNQKKLDALAANLREQGADCEARAVAHALPALRDLFAGRKVVINISGPFSLLGREVVDAALASGCHYLDSTGEQDFMLDMRRDYDRWFKEAGLILSPSAAYLWGPGSAAIDVCLEVPGIDSFEVVYAPPSLQTMASLQSMVRVARRPGFQFRKNKLAELPIGSLKRVKVSNGEKRFALRLGTGEPTFLLDDPRVKYTDVLFASNTLALAVPSFTVWNYLSKVISGETLDRWSDKMVETLKRNPGREEPESGKYVIDVTGTGPGGKVSVTLNGTSPYLFTGFVCAMTAEQLLKRKPLRTGYVSASQALGARYLLKRLEDIDTFTTVEVKASGSQVRTMKTATA